MGIMVVLIVYAVALTIAASVASIVLGGAAYALLRHSTAKRKRAVRASITFPFLCVAFAGGWFAIYAITNYTVFHRDPGLGDGWDTPLPNGYALMMIDTTDQGAVYKPMSKSGDRFNESDHKVDGVRQLQVSKNLIFGARDTGYFGRIGQESTFVDSYFELDTTKDTYQEFKTIEELRQQAANQGVSVQLRPFDSVFGDYRTTWFDYLSAIILLLVPAVGFFLLSRWIWRMRRSSLPELAPITDSNPV